MRGVTIEALKDGFNLRIEILLIESQTADCRKAVTAPGFNLRIEILLIERRSPQCQSR